MCKRRFLSLGFLSAILACAPAAAEIVEFTFEGSIQFVVGNFSAPLNGLAAGHTYEFKVAFDSNTVDQDASPTLGQYFDPVQTYEITTNTAALAGVPSLSFMAVDDETVPGQESFEVGIGVIAFILGGQVGLPAGTLSSDALPTTLELSDLSGFQFTVFDTLTEASAIGNLTAFSDGSEEVPPGGTSGEGPQPAPAVSSWAMIILTVLLSAGIAIRFGKHQRNAASHTSP